MNVGSAAPRSLIVDPVESGSPAEPGEFFEADAVTSQVDRAAFFMQGSGRVDSDRTVGVLYLQSSSAPRHQFRQALKRFSERPVDYVVVLHVVAVVIAFPPDAAVFEPEEIILRRERFQSDRPGDQFFRHARQV